MTTRVQAVAAALRNNDGKPYFTMAEAAITVTLAPQPIDTAPFDRRILAFMWGQWRVAKWDNDCFVKKPRPYWRADDLQTLQSRFYQPKWWAEFPPAPEEAS